MLSSRGKTRVDGEVKGAKKRVILKDNPLEAA